GGLITAARGRSGLRPMILASLGFGASILITALSPFVLLAYAALLFAGWASVSFISIGNSSIQLAADPAMRGRALSLWQVAFQGTTPIGGPIIGLVIATSNARVGLLVGAIAALAAAGLGTILGRSTLAAEDQREVASEKERVVGL